MSSPTNGAPNIAPSAPRAAAAAATAAAPMSTPELLAAMLRTSPKISDLFFSPGKPPLVEISGKLAPAGATRALTNDDTRPLATDLIGSNQDAMHSLTHLGSSNEAYSLSRWQGFAVNASRPCPSCAL